MISSLCISLLINFYRTEREYKLGGAKGDLTSPNFPSNYPVGIDYQYYITVQPESRIKLKFASFDLEETTRCSYDYLSIYNGADVSSPLVGRYCGRSRPNDVVSTGNKLYLRFVSDARNVGKGFKLSWEELKKEESKEGTKNTFIYFIPLVKKYLIYMNISIFNTITCIWNKIC